ncbi:MAG: hypothetical protein IT323_08665 [Anaerolineae bacterium]|nr:hypothetical protein [Anaerolineae bacterium]
MDEDRSEAAWRALATAALMGTERAPFAPPVAAGGLGSALAAIDPSNPERALLDSAALLVAYRRAGALPGPAGAESPSGSPPEPLPPAGERAANALETVLRSPMAFRLVQEWCRLADEAGVRTPDQHLPALLDLAARNPDIVPSLPGGVGARGRWLAAYNPAWRLLALEPGREGDAWATGNRATRLFALQMARQRDPDAARMLLQSTWKTEPADDRLRFMQIMERGLSLADEPFLESALTDRSKGVRILAAALLSQIGDSRLAARMADRLRPLIRFDRASGRIQVALPEACDAEMQRDGIQLEPPVPDLGEKTWWFAQMLRCVPPRVWVAELGAPPGALIAAAERSIWKPPLLESWTEAALAHADADWLLHLPVECFRVTARVKLAVERLPEAVLHRLINHWLQIATPLGNGHPLVVLLHSPALLTRPQTRLALDKLRQMSDPPADAGLLLASHLVMSLHPSAVGDVEAALGVQDGDFKRWGGIMRDALQFLYLRREMYAAFGKL